MMYCCAMRHLSMCYLLVLAVITSGAFFVEPLCTKRKRIFNPPLSLHLSFFLSFELSILPSFKYHVFSLIFSFSYSLSSPFLTPHHTGSLLPSPQLPLPLRFSPLLYCPLPDCPLYSNLYFFLSACSPFPSFFQSCFLFH